MGMDVYGLDPIIKEGTSKPEMPDFNQLSDEDRQAYFNAVDLYERENPGVYFRANVWWWRPLWMYITDICEDVISEQDIEMGHSNSGYEYSADVCKVIEERLAMAIESNAHHMYERDYKQLLDQLEQVKCQHCNGTGTRDDKFVQGECNACHGTGKTDDWRKSYPFAAEVVEDFHKFVKNSGGFKIC